jgi:uncharacterized circularly permuted ATP-grasp superfamily protein
VKINHYDIDGFYDEVFDNQGTPRLSTAKLVRNIENMPAGELVRRQNMVEKAMLNTGITFGVYGSEDGDEKIWPFDAIPRIISKSEWENLEAGLKQRIRALNLFIDDVYHDKKIIKDGIIPEQLIYSASGYQPECEGLHPPKGIWCHISGVDLIRDDTGTFYVLEDNLRCPSGVSYVLENRTLMKRTLPKIFNSYNVQPVDDYPLRLLDMLNFISPNQMVNPAATVLTPGIFNSAYFEHSFLAKHMGVRLVEGTDLTLRDGYVMMRTTRGFEKVDVIYRRIDDNFLDPQVFRSDSLLGVPGLMEAYRKGRVALANAPGAGVADDKAIYAYVPKIIKYYLDEDPIIPNVPTYLCSEPETLKYVLANLDKLVVKPTAESGGYGMLIGTTSTPEERQTFAEKIKQHPRNFIAQPTLALSRSPVIVDEHLEGRHVDMRPFIIYGEDIYVLPGGLTRVALKKGSLVVNSSQGGGSKDTWVLA